MQKYVIPKNSPEDVILFSCEGCNAKFLSDFSCREHEIDEEYHENQIRELADLKDRFRED